MVIDLSEEADRHVAEAVEVGGCGVAGMDEDRVGAMSAALLSLGDRAVRELARGTLERVLLQGERGYVIMSSSGTEAVLTVLAKQNAKLGLLFLDIKRAAEALSKLI